MRHYIVLFLVLAYTASAENGAPTNNTPPPVPPPGVGYPGYGNQPNSGFNKLNPNNIQVFDNDFFKDSQPTPTSNTTPKGRAYSDRAEFNTENRKRALEKCEALKNKNFAEYQNCYKNDLANVKKGVQEGYDEVEKRQSMPLRNAPNSLVEEQMRNPSGSQDDE